MRVVAAVVLTVATVTFFDQAPPDVVRAFAMLMGGVYLTAMAVGLFVTRWRP